MPNRRAWEAVLQWWHGDGLIANYRLVIRDCVYNLGEPLQEIKQSLSRPHEMSRSFWHFKNILKFVFNFLRSEEAHALQAWRGINRPSYPTHYAQAMWCCIQKPFEFDHRMFNPEMRRWNHDLNEMSQIIDEFDDKQSLYYSNDGQMTFITAYTLATQVNDAETHVRMNTNWLDKNFLHMLLYTLRDYLLKPIWSAKKIEAMPPIPIPIAHRDQILSFANKITCRFDNVCRGVAAKEGWSLNAAKLNTNMIIACWRLWQEAAVLFANLLQELLVVNTNLGIHQLCVQRQAYLQILLYASFLGGSRASASQATKRLLPLLHKHLFEGLAQKEADVMNKSGIMAVVQRASPMSKGQSLQALVAEQRPGLNDFLFVPGPAVPP